MSEWLDYAISDFLLFSPEVYWRLFALENAALFPWSALAPLSCAAAFFGLFWRPRAAGAALSMLLAAGWVVAGASFLWLRYGAINWAAPYAAPLFAAAALALVILPFARPSEPRALPRRAGLALLLYGVAAYPLMATAFGRSWATAELVGVAPDPTAAATLGLSFFLRPGLVRLALRSAAATWLSISAATLWALGEAETAAPIVVLVFGLAGLLAERGGRRIGSQ